MPDKSVMLGIAYQGKETVELVVDPERGELRLKELAVKESLKNPKITFHQSGQYKLNARVGLSEESIDRCTVVGPRLDEIKRRRMAEILIPNTLTRSKRVKSIRDIELDATGFPRQLLRCTVWCCKRELFDEFMAYPKQMVNTSQNEFTNAVEDGSKVWAFTLRTTESDTVLSDKFYIHLPGEVKWGNGDDAS
ncbi:MAG: hypothetical protein IIA05_01790 [Proteobacteria bacterium]|nr:hypothetical protein [Pseudomonadota bacterium]